MQNNKPLLGILVTSMPIDTPSKMFAFCQFMIAWISPDFDKRNPVLSTMTSTLLNLRIILLSLLLWLIIAMHSFTRMADPEHDSLLPWTRYSLYVLLHLCI